MEATELFERYLQAVRTYLPRRGRGDIVAELRANLEAQREEREAELGRPLTEGEMVDWLKELGPPLEMASRYHAPRYLIGPAIFPLYWWVLRLAAFCASLVYAISIIVRVIFESHGPDWVAGQIFQYPAILITVAAWVTAAFAILQFVSERYPEKCPDLVASKATWSPASLPPLEKELPPGSKPRSFTAAVAELVAHFFVLVWILLIPTYPFLLMGPGAAILQHSPVRPAQVLWLWYWTIVGLNILQLVWQGISFLAGTWRIRTGAQRLVLKGMELLPLLILLTAPGHVYFEANAAEAARMPAGIDLATVNRWLLFAVVAISCLVVIQFGRDLWKANRVSRRRHLAAVL